MLDWLTRLFKRSPGAPVGPVRQTTDVRVTHDEDVIRLARSGVPEMRLSWTEIVSVGLVSGDTLSDPPELFWLLHGRDRRRTLLVPMGAPGEHELVHAMQERLAGFDNMAVVEAMSATGSVGFKVWDADWGRAPGVV
jgi:hypothetical protein